MPEWVEQWLPGFGPVSEDEIEPSESDINEGDANMSKSTTTTTTKYNPWTGDITQTVVRNDNAGGWSYSSTESTYIGDMGSGLAFQGNRERLPVEAPNCVGRAKRQDYTKYQRDLMNPRIRSLENAARESKKRACNVVLQIRDDLLAVRESLLKADADTGLELVDTLLDNIENHISER